MSSGSSSPVQQKESKGKAEPNTDKAELLLRRRESCIYNLKT
jgi:hypothetical protein